MGVKNGERFLPESINSILAQTFNDFEFIIVDDGSTDATSEILKEYSSKDSRVKVVTNPENFGLTRSLNIGIRAAHGEYIARMDAGDTSEPERFSKQVEFLDRNLDHVLVGSFASTFDENSKKVGEMNSAIDSESVKKVLIRYNPIVHSSIMVRKDILEKAGNYNEAWKYAQDYEMYFRLMKFGKLANLPEQLVSYRLSPNSITRKKNNKQVGFAIKARIKAIKEGQYSFFSYIHLLRPLLGLILPYNTKEFIKRI